MIVISLCLVFIAWVFVCLWKIIMIAAKNAVDEAEKENFDPLHTLTNTEGNLKP